MTGNADAQEEIEQAIEHEEGKTLGEQMTFTS